MPSAAASTAPPTTRSARTTHTTTCPEPFFREAFEGWLGALPVEGRVLEIGCGHGEPIAAALAAAGLRVTGIDPSAAMIAQARKGVTEGEFRQMTLAELDETDAFDGSCCFFSLLCMDPIETADRPGAAAQGTEGGCASVDRLRRAGPVHAHIAPAHSAGTDDVGVDNTITKTWPPF